MYKKNLTILLFKGRCMKFSSEAVDSSSWETLVIKNSVMILTNRNICDYSITSYILVAMQLTFSLFFYLLIHLYTWGFLGFIVRGWLGRDIYWAFKENFRIFSRCQIWVISDFFLAVNKLVLGITMSQELCTYIRISSFNPHSNLWGTCWSSMENGTYT